MKRRFPFRLGTTSYILHDEVLPNVHFLKEKVDHIELLVFEFNERAPYPPKPIIDELSAIAQDADLTYTVHLPICKKLGTPDEAERTRNVELMLRVIEHTTPLSPLAWDLHLELNDAPVTDPHWQDTCLRSLNELKRSGVDPKRVGIENLEFDYAPILSLLNETGFAVTLDMGHVWHHGFDEEFHLTECLPRAISVHLHGYNEERDHKGLHLISPKKLTTFLDAVAAHPSADRLPVSIEVFSENNFNQSMTALKLLDQTG